MTILLAVLIMSFVGTTPLAGASANGSVLPAGHSCHPSIESQPREIVLSCAHGMEYVGSLTWSKWGPSSAVGTGRLMQNSCVPGCTGGSIVSRGAVDVDATSPVSVEGQRVFTRLRLTKVADRSYALLAWGAKSSPTSTWGWITPSFVPAPSAKGLVLDTATMHLDGVPPIPDAPDIIMNAVETEVYYALTPRLGPPKVIASTICHGALRVTVDQWQDLSLVFEGGISVLLYYNYGGWAGAQSPHPTLPPSGDELWPKLTTSLGIGIGTPLVTARKIDPHFRGGVTDGFTDGSMSLFSVTLSTRGSSSSPAAYEISQIGAAGGNC